jgi:acetyl-CoA C-acetyltransferase
LRQRIVIYFNHRCLFSLRQHALKVSDCSQIHRGRSGGGFVLETFRRKSATARGRATHRLCAHDGLFVAEKKDASDFPIARKAAEQACLASARATLMARKCNDCFSISEIVQYEILGFAERGEGAQLIESGATSLPSGPFARQRWRRFDRRRPSRRCDRYAAGC